MLNLQAPTRRAGSYEGLRTTFSIVVHSASNEKVQILNRFQKRKQPVHAQQWHPVIQVAKKVGGSSGKETGKGVREKLFSPVFFG